MASGDLRGANDLKNFFGLTQPRAYHTVPAVRNANFFLTYTGAAMAPDVEGRC